MPLKPFPALFRIILLAVLFLSCYLVLIVRLWDEQIRSGADNIERISSQSVRRIRLPAVRGRIFTSDGRLLADNRPSYDAVFHFAEMRQPGRQSKTLDHIMDCASRLGSALRRDLELTREDLLRQMNMRPGLPFAIFRDLNAEELALAAEISPPIPGMEIVVSPLRAYPAGSMAAHVIGYTGLEDPKQAEDREDYFYYVPDQEGKSGIEKKYDVSVPGTEVPENPDSGVRGMRGIPGSSVVRVDHKGYVFETIGTPVPAQSGNDLILSLDWRAQKAAERALSGQKGAMVLLDADSGAVIAMASSPSYDLESFVPNVKAEVWKAYNENPERPLINRATMGEYAPGSILKPLVAIAAMRAGVTIEQQITCDGGTQIGNAVIKCWSWRSGGHGVVDMYHAIQMSCNNYFINKGLAAGLDGIFQVLQSAGIGQRSGFPLPEAKGLLPSRSEKQRLYKNRWNEYDTALLSIGQGIVLVTPLQAASWFAAIANGGTLWKPYIVREVQDHQGNTLYRAIPEKKNQLLATPAQLEVVRKGMWMVVNTPEGSAKGAKNAAVTLFGKTGTAEMGPRNNRYANTWFAGFAERDGRRYSVAILIEHGVSGGRTCAPLVAQFFIDWLGTREESAEEPTPDGT
ncbi:MAG: penicillin-binding protein 2 [Lentisphaerae bacterium GWF2_52_8]|nr:MAG: penicillin-binding protein 2 [Lentisphaerae bacterium GWF2_52_8]